MKTRIGIDCRNVLDPSRGEGAGIGHYVDALVRALVDSGTDHRFVLFFDKHARPAIRRELKGHPNVEVRTFPFHVIASRIPLLHRHVVVSSLFGRSRLDLLHGPANTVPAFYKGRYVVTVHDLAIYDHPEWFPSPFPGANSFSTRMTVPYSIEKAARVMAVSESTAADVVRLFERDRGDIDVVYGGADAMPHPDGLDYPDHRSVLAEFGVAHNPYVLSVGTVEPRKNFARAVRAFSEFFRSTAPRHDGMRYVIAGKRGWKWKETVAAIAEENARIARETGVPNAIIEAGYVTSAQKRTLYAHAMTVMCPSLHEGFGLPIIEGMAAGVPVIAGDAGAMPEIAGSAAVLVDPMDVVRMARAIEGLVEHHERRATLKGAGRLRAKAFTWEKVAERTLASYARALGQG